MTNEESKKHLECVIGNVSLEYVMKPIKVDALKNAVCALEKRIPKKPITNDVGGQLELICPGCENDYVARNGRAYSFCPSCGQKVDWNEDEG